MGVSQGDPEDKKLKLSNSIVKPDGNRWITGSPGHSAKKTFLWKFYVIFVPERHFCGVSQVAKNYALKMKMALTINSATKR
jgi:hypothetical protein